MTNYDSPLKSIQAGNWFKLICGASFQDLPTIRSLALAYTLAGADCIDVAADKAVVRAAQEGILAAQNLQAEAYERGYHPLKPWLMVSLNDAEDPHFRKAEFDVTSCPSVCPQPCIDICPAQAISFNQSTNAGVIDERCYGCGRCLPICPEQLIFTRAYVSTPQVVAANLETMAVDAIEIHTQVGNFVSFQRLWSAISPQLKQLKLLAISCPDHAKVSEYLRSLYDLISPLSIPLIWQTDGRPMSGDIGKGTTHAAVKLAQKVLRANLPGHVQLAGGTNQYTVTKLQQAQMLKKTNKSTGVIGIAYGSYARSLLLPIINQLSSVNSLNSLPLKQIQFLETRPDLLWQAVAQANQLVKQIKQASLVCANT